MKCSGASTPPSSQLNARQLSTLSQSPTASSGQLRVDARVSVPAHSPLVPGVQFQPPSVLNPVFIDSRPASVRPAAISPPSAVVAVPLIAPAVFPRQYTDLNAVPHSVNVSPVMQPRIISAGLAVGTSPRLDNDAEFTCKLQEQPI